MALDKKNVMTSKVILEEYIDSWRRYGPTDYKDLDREDPYGPMTYLEALEAIQKLGYQRFPRPNELFEKVCTALDSGTQSPFLKDVFHQSEKTRGLHGGYLPNDGEWLSMGLIFDKKKMVFLVDPYKSEVQTEFPVYGGGFVNAADVIEANGVLWDKFFFDMHHLSELTPDITELLWSRSHAELTKLGENCFFHVSKYLTFPSGLRFQYFKEGTHNPSPDQVVFDEIDLKYVRFLCLDTSWSYQLYATADGKRLGRGALVERS